MAWFAQQTVKGRQLASIIGLHLQSGVFYRVSSLQLFAVTPCPPCHRKSTLSQSAAHKENSTIAVSAVANPEFRNVYTFRFIVHTRVLSRLKIYQSMLTVAAIPPAIYLHDAGALSGASLASFFGIATLATAMLYVMSNLFRHMVGIISVNEKENIVRISHLTFWGRRRNVDFDVSDIVPLSDMSVKSNDIYQVIHFYDSPLKFYWFLRYAKNADIDTVQRIFGKF